MENKLFCQSCSMPLDSPSMMGSELNGMKNKEYCIYCYQNGKFVNPGMTLEEMKTLVKEQMEKRKLNSNLINMTVNSLPHLKRWRDKTPSL